MRGSWISNFRSTSSSGNKSRKQIQVVLGGKGAKRVRSSSTHLRKIREAGYSKLFVPRFGRDLDCEGRNLDISRMRELKLDCSRSSTMVQNSTQKYSQRERDTFGFNRR